MTKSELGVGMFVKLSCGTICLVDYDEDLINISNGCTVNDLLNYNENLESKNRSDYDIVEVYSGIESFKNVWKREEKNVKCCIFNIFDFTYYVYSIIF